MTAEIIVALASRTYRSPSTVFKVDVVHQLGRCCSVGSVDILREPEEVAGVVYFVESISVTLSCLDCSAAETVVAFIFVIVWVDVICTAQSTGCFCGACGVASVIFASFCVTFCTDEAVCAVAVVGSGVMVAMVVSANLDVAFLLCVVVFDHAIVDVCVLQC